MINALKNAPPSEKKALTGWLTRKEFDPVEKINAVTGIFDNLNIRELTEERIKDYYRAAISSLEHLNRPADRKTELLNFASFLMNRQK